MALEKKLRRLMLEKQNSSVPMSPSVRLASEREAKDVRVRLLLKKKMSNNG